MGCSLTCDGCRDGGVDALGELCQLLGALSRFDGSCEKVRHGGRFDPARGVGETVMG